MVKKNKPLYWIAGLLALLILGAQLGWFKSISVTPPQDMEVQIPPTQQPAYNSCSQLCPANNFDEGYAVVGDCDTGEAKVTYGYAGQPSLLSCCCYDEVEPEDEDEGEFLDDFHDDDECEAGCGIRGYDAGECWATSPYGDDAVQIGICSEDNDYPCWCWDYITGEDPFCIDSDGGIEPFTSGYVTSQVGNYYDKCVSGTRVKEYFCTGGITVTSMEKDCGTGYSCVDISSGDYCAPIDSDGDGFSDSEEIAAGTNPNDPNSFPGGYAETTADYCNALGFAWSNYMPGSSPSGCLAEAYNVCFPIFGLQYEDSTYSDPNCCFACI